MANVLDGFVATFTRVPFIKPPDLQRMFTPIPRAIITFVVNQGVVSAKPTNDTQTVQVAADVPFQFAYRMIDSSLMIAQGAVGGVPGAFQYTDGGELQITNAMRGQPLGTTTRHLLVGTNVHSFVTIVEQKFWRIERNPSLVVQSIASGVAAGLDWRVVNIDTVATAAGTLNFLCTMYEYDIEQVQMYPPLVPTLTYNIQ